MNICFDLDGPIIDVSDRYYRAYLESLKGTDSKKPQVLSKEHFWNLKQSRISDFEIGILSGLSLKESAVSAEQRKDLTFMSEYHSLDKLFSDVSKTFEYLKENNSTFFIVTLRRRKHIEQAIKELKLNKYIGAESIFCLENNHKFTNDIQEKYILLVNAINRLELDPYETVIIGDSETDIHAGRLARYRKVAAITRGIRSKEQLEILKPDFILNSLTEIVNLEKLCVSA